MDYRIPWSAVCAFVALLWFSASQPAAGDSFPAAPTDFAVYFEDSRGNKIDTARDSVTKDLVADPDRTIFVRLTRAEKSRIYAKFLELKVFDIREPAPKTDSKRWLSAAPSIFLKFEITASGVVKRFAWPGQPTTNTSSDEWRRLRLALGYVRGVVEARPEFRRLPEPSGFYE